MKKLTNFPLGYLVIALLAIVLMRDMWVNASQVELIPYSEFLNHVKNAEVADITISKYVIEGKRVKPTSDGQSRIVTTRVDTLLATEISQYDVKFAGVIENTIFRDLLSWVPPAIAFFWIWMFLASRMGADGMGGGLMSIGKSNAKVFAETDTKVSFADLAGVNAAKGGLREVVGFLKDPQGYGRPGGRLPNGVLLVGQPGTGEMPLARAVTGEVDVPFFSISSSEFVEKFVGVGAVRLRDSFEHARKKAPAINFIAAIVLTLTSWEGLDLPYQLLIGEIS